MPSSESEFSLSSSENVLEPEASSSPDVRIPDADRFKLLSCFKSLSSKYEICRILIDSYPAPALKMDFVTILPYQETVDQAFENYLFAEVYKIRKAIKQKSLPFEIVSTITLGYTLLYKGAITEAPKAWWAIFTATQLKIIYSLLSNPYGVTTENILRIIEQSETTIIDRYPTDYSNKVELQISRLRKSLVGFGKITGSRGLQAYAFKPSEDVDPKKLQAELAHVVARLSH